MPLDEPSWWYAAEPGPWPKLLAPLSHLYGWAAETRYRRATPYRSRLPVLCIGNFTAGGTGKTPLTIHVCQHLKASGQAPVALTRGYGGRLAGPHWVEPERDTSATVGDEALLLARTAPTVLARDRAQGARAIEEGAHPATVIVMDDGLQNPQLAKDLVIAVVEGRRGFGNGEVLPAGPLRAALAFQLELTDAIVVNEPEGGDGTVAEWLRRRFAGPVLRATASPAADTAWLQGARVLAWAGIGAPQRFFELLARQGAEIAAKRSFRDHQRLNAGDAAALLEESRRLTALLVTTEKDHVRLSGETGALAELAAASRTLPIKLAFSPFDAQRLSDLLAAALISPSRRVEDTPPA